jgi:hypothetical protein
LPETPIPWKQELLPTTPLCQPLGQEVKPTPFAGQGIFLKNDKLLPDNKIS